LVNMLRQQTNPARAASPAHLISNNRLKVKALFFIGSFACIRNLNPLLGKFKFNRAEKPEITHHNYKGVIHPILFN
jgi:hypothetical protein